MTIPGHALITGGGTGIGAAIARTLAAAGVQVTLVGRRREPLTEVAGEVGGTVAVADVCDPAQVAAAFAAARAAHGPLTILVNNAGGTSTAPFGRASFADWRSVMGVNLDALFHCCQAALPDVRAAAAGRIVTIASTAGVKGYPYVAAYVAAKHGAIGLTRALAAELTGAAVTVNAVCPGFTNTELVAASVAAITAATGRDEASARASLAAFNPQRRLIDPQEVADTVLWLCQPGSRSITGQAIAVAGGEVT